MSRPSISFDRIADRYDETRGGLERGIRFASYIAPHLDRSLPALEVGVGTGVLAAAMGDRGFDVTGLDLSPEMLAHARGRVRRAIVADAVHMPLADAGVAQSYAAWVLHLVGDPRAVLREVARVLVPGGRYVDVTGGASVEPFPGAPALDEMEAALRARVWSEARTADGLIAIAAETGLAVVEHVVSDPIAFRTTPATVIERIETRAYSYLWDVDEQTWARLVEPALAQLRALPDDPVDRVVREHTVVLERR